MRLSVCATCRNNLREKLRVRLRLLQSSRQASTFTSRSWYWDTSPPSDRQLAAAGWFFKQHPPRKVWTATEWRKDEKQDADGILIPEIAFLGRSNVGKSSLLNAVLNSPGLNYVGPKPGKTQLLHAWGLAPSDPKTGGALKGWKGNTDTRVVVLDAPGYGFRSRSSWGAEILNYMKYRKQLRRIFVLIDANHGVKKHDKQMLDMLQEKRIPHQLIVSKADRQKDLESILRTLQPVAQPRGTVAGLGEILAVGGLGEGPKKASSGVTDVQWAILRAAGLEEYVMEQYLRLDKDAALKYSDQRQLPNAPSHLCVEDMERTSQEPPPPPISLGWSTDPISATPTPLSQALSNPLRASRSISQTPSSPTKGASLGRSSRSSILPQRPAPTKYPKVESPHSSANSRLDPIRQPPPQPSMPMHSARPSSSHRAGVFHGMAGLQQATSPTKPARPAQPTGSTRAGVFQGMAGLQEAVGGLSKAKTKRSIAKPGKKARIPPMREGRVNVREDKASRRENNTA
jgi:GTP-binding protein